MKALITILFIILLSTLLPGQDTLTIKGIVTDENTGEPLPGVNVFISNTFIGTITDSDGEFELKNIPKGIPTLVISMVGYEREYKKIEFESRMKERSFEFELKEKTYKLDNVNVVTDEGDWKDYYKIFVREFIGTRRYGDQCEILNPYPINFYYVDSSNVLKADCDSMLTLINKALGYKINFILTHFEFSTIYPINPGSYQMQAFFELLTPKDSLEEKKWITNRNESYYSSSRPFFKSIINSNVDNEIYGVFKREYSYNDEGEKEYESPLFEDIEAGDLDFEYDPVEDYYIMDIMFDMMILRYDGLNYSETKYQLTFPHDELFIRPDGTIVYQDDLIYNRAWARFRVSDLLPFGFEPTEKR